MKIEIATEMLIRLFNTLSTLIKVNKISVAISLVKTEQDFVDKLAWMLQGSE